MTKEDILRVTKLYRNSQEFSYHKNIKTGITIKHCYNMLDKIDEFAEIDIEKAFRWLGFVQGCLWSENIYSIDDLRYHNKGNT